MWTAWWGTFVTPVLVRKFGLMVGWGNRLARRACC